MEITVSGRRWAFRINKQRLEVLGLPPAKRSVTARLCGEIAIQTKEQEGRGSDRDIFIFHWIISWLISKQKICVHPACSEPLCHRHTPDIRLWCNLVLPPRCQPHASGS